MRGTLISFWAGSSAARRDRPRMASPINGLVERYPERRRSTEVIVGRRPPSRPTAKPRRAWFTPKRELSPLGGGHDPAIGVAASPPNGGDSPSSLDPRSPWSRAPLARSPGAMVDSAAMKTANRGQGLPLWIGPVNSSGVHSGPSTPLSSLSYTGSIPLTTQAATSTFNNLPPATLRKLQTQA